MVFGVRQQYQQETAMSGDSSRFSNQEPRAPAHICDEEAVSAWRPSAAGAREWTGLGSEPLPPRERLARLARTIETDVIPRLVLAHRPSAEHLTFAAPVLAVSDVDSFVQLVMHGSEGEMTRHLDARRGRGVLIESLYLELFAPAARSLGVMWEEDVCDFSTVTVALGRLQRLLRELSPAFGAEVEHPAHGRRALFVQPRDEQHSFGLSMVAEFFRREGWDVLGGVGGAVSDPATKVRDEWIDVVGFSVGGDHRMDWLRETIAATRTASRNRDLIVLVGGPLFANNPELVRHVGADATTRDAREAPQVAERLLSKGTARK